MKIEKGNMTVEDMRDNLKEVENGVTCGCDNPKLRTGLHIDGTDYYEYHYDCMNCGNRIVMTAKREVSW